MLYVNVYNNEGVMEDTISSNHKNSPLVVRCNGMFGFAVVKNPVAGYHSDASSTCRADATWDSLNGVKWGSSGSGSGSGSDGADDKEVPHCTTHD